MIVVFVVLLLIIIINLIVVVVSTHISHKLTYATLISCYLANQLQNSVGVISGSSSHGCNASELETRGRSAAVVLC